VVAEGDVDSLCAAVVVHAAVRRRGGDAAIVIGRDARLPARPAALVIAAGDAGVEIAGVPTLRLDALRAAASRVPAATLAWELVHGWAAVDDLDWLPALASFIELGAEQPFAEMNEGSSRWSSRHLVEAAALLNAARRAGGFRPEVALEALATARSPADLLEARAPDSEALRAWRDEVNAEIERCTRTAPRFAGRVAVIRFSSPAQVHPIVATRWIRRLKKMIVMAVNDGWIPGRVSFALRSSDPRLDLVAFLRGLAATAGVREPGGGHPRATGGSVTPAELDRLLRALGLDPATPARPLPRSRSSGGRSPAPPARRRSASYGPKPTGS
jgi:hypothetical protein